MTTREHEIVKAILDAGHDEEGRQFSEPTLHVAVNLRMQSNRRPDATLEEFDAALKLTGQRGWMTRIISTITGRSKWNINTAGEAARLEL